MTLSPGRASAPAGLSGSARSGGRGAHRVRDGEDAASTHRVDERTFRLAQSRHPKKSLRGRRRRLGIARLRHLGVDTVQGSAKEQANRNEGGGLPLPRPTLERAPCSGTTSITTPLPRSPGNCS